MKKLILILMAITMVTSVQAEETYIVGANESLFEIAVKHGLTWQKLWQANPEIFDSTIIFTGQELRIPEPSPFLWQNPGGDPFGKKDFSKAINMFSLPAKVKVDLIVKVKNHEAENYYIRHGDYFSQMVFDNYRLVNKVIAAWPDSTKRYEAKLYFCQSNSLEYYLIAPTVCNNWAWWKEEILRKEEPVKIEKDFEVEEEKILLAKPAKKDSLVFAHRDETYLWTGHYFPLRGQGGSNYYGGKSNFFFTTKGAFLGRVHFGIGAIANGWQGKSGSGFSYEGFRVTAGPVLDMTKKGFRFTSSLQYGRQQDQGRDGKGYKAEQETSIIYFGLTLDSYGDGSQVYKARRFESWLDFNFDVGHNKESHWLDNSIPKRDDPAGNKTSASFGGRFYLGHLKSLKTGLVTKANYAWEDGGITGVIGFVISSREDIAKFGIEFKNTSNSKYDDANGNSISITFDLEPQKRIFK